MNDAEIRTAKRALLTKSILGYRKTGADSARAERSSSAKVGIDKAREPSLERAAKAKVGLPKIATR